MRYRTTWQRTALPLLLVVALASCASPKRGGSAAAEKPTGVIAYNVELTAAADTAQALRDECDRSQLLTSIATDVRPTARVVHRTVAGSVYSDTLVRILAMPCEGSTTRPEYLLPLSRIAGRAYTSVADPLEPPMVIRIRDAEPLDMCCRLRTGWGVFDKVELRLAAGVRFGSDSVTYPIVDANQNPVAPFQETYRSSFFGFGRGGSNIVPAIEAAGLWKLDRIGRAHLGVFTGVMPTDGSVFIPIGAQGRYTFSPAPNTDELDPSCHTPYVYGLAALPIDFSSGAPIIGSSFDRQRYMLGLGIGYDWAATCDLDVSVDVGVRHMNLPLPEIDCCPNVPDSERNPFRQSTMLMVRFGLTF